MWVVPNIVMYNVADLTKVFFQSMGVGVGAAAGTGMVPQPVPQPG